MECEGEKGERSDAEMFLVELLENKLLFQIGKKNRVKQIEKCTRDWDLYK